MVACGGQRGLGSVGAPHFAPQPEAPQQRHRQRQQQRRGEGQCGAHQLAGARAGVDVEHRPARGDGRAFGVADRSQRALQQRRQLWLVAPHREIQVGVQLRKNTGDLHRGCQALLQLGHRERQIGERSIDLAAGHGSQQTVARRVLDPRHLGVVLRQQESMLPAREHAHALAAQLPDVDQRAAVLEGDEHRRRAGPRPDEEEVAPTLFVVGHRQQQVDLAVLGRAKHLGPRPAACRAGVQSDAPRHQRHVVGRHAVETTLRVAEGVGVVRLVVAQAQRGQLLDELQLLRRQSQRHRRRGQQRAQRHPAAMNFLPLGQRDGVQGAVENLLQHLVVGGHPEAECAQLAVHRATDFEVGQQQLFDQEGGGRQGAQVDIGRVVRDALQRLRRIVELDDLRLRMPLLQRADHRVAALHRHPHARQTVLGPHRTDAAARQIDVGHIEIRLGEAHEGFALRRARHRRHDVGTVIAQRLQAVLQGRHRGVLEAQVQTPFDQVQVVAREAAELPLVGVDIDRCPIMLGGHAQPGVLDQPVALRIGEPQRRYGGVGSRRCECRCRRMNQHRSQHDNDALQQAARPRHT